MRRLQPADSSARHLTAGQYHSRALRKKQDAPVFAESLKEIDLKRADLKMKVGDTNEANEALVELTADADNAELVVEDTVRNIQGDIKKLNRERPELNIESKVFPEGLEGVIGPEGKKQPEAIATFRNRLVDFKDVGLDGQPLVANSISKLDAVTAVMVEALNLKAAGEKKVRDCFDLEKKARTAVREQLEGAHGLLRHHFQARPTLADRYFDPNLRSDGATGAAEERGRALGKAESILGSLSHRAILVSEENKKAILAMTDIATLEKWLERSFTVATAAEVIA